MCMQPSGIVKPMSPGQCLVRSGKICDKLRERVKNSLAKFHDEMPSHIPSKKWMRARPDPASLCREVCEAFLRLLLFRFFHERVCLLLVLVAFAFGVSYVHIASLCKTTIINTVNMSHTKEDTNRFPFALAVEAFRVSRSGTLGPPKFVGSA